MSGLTPKRGFALDYAFDEFGSPGSGIEIGTMREFPSDVPVLLVPEPDRDPTDDELKRLVKCLYGRLAAQCPTPAARAHRLSVARAAWKLGAREPACG